MKSSRSVLFWALDSSWIARAALRASRPLVVKSIRSVLFWASVSSWIARAALRASRSPFGEINSFGVILGPCFVLDCPSCAARASRSPFGEINSFGVILDP